MLSYIGERDAEELIVCVVLTGNLVCKVSLRDFDNRHYNKFYFIYPKCYYCCNQHNVFRPVSCEINPLQ